MSMEKGAPKDFGRMEKVLTKLSSLQGNANLLEKGKEGFSYR